MVAAQNAPSVDRQQRRIATAFAAGLAFVALPSFEVEAASCRGHPQSVRVAIKKQIEALRALEREAADRLKGLDTRPFDYLLDRARAAAAVIADKGALAAEAGLSRCPQSIPPVRRVCAEAAHALVSLIGQQADGYATGKTKQPEPKQAEAKPTEVKEAQSKQADAKQAYARAHAAMRAMDGPFALGHRVPDHGLILGCRRAWRSEKHVKNGLIATPGGSVSRPPDTIPSLLRIDAAAVG